jgi:uncharacterized protein (TIGR02246 family)
VFNVFSRITAHGKVRELTLAKKLNGDRVHSRPFVPAADPLSNNHPETRRRTMKMHVLLAFAGLASGFSLPAFALEKDEVDPKIEQQIRVLAANYDAAINKHDPAAVAALYAHDAVRATALNDGTFHGRPAIEKAYAKYDFGRWQVSNYFTRIYRLTQVGNEVRLTGAWSSVYTREGDHVHPSNGDGCWSWVIVREGDTWKIRRDSASGGASPCHMNTINSL